MCRIREEELEHNELPTTPANVAPVLLSEQAIKVFLNRTHPVHFEKLSVEKCPRRLYPRQADFYYVFKLFLPSTPLTSINCAVPHTYRLLATALLMDPYPRDFAIRVLMRHWPIPTLSVDDLSAAYSPFAALTAAVARQQQKRKMGVAGVAGTPPPPTQGQQGVDPQAECRVDIILACLMDNFMANLGYAHHRSRLKVGNELHIN